MLPALPPEAQLLILCGQEEQNDSAIETLVSGGIEWSQAVALAFHANALASFARRVIPIAGKRIPEEDLDRIRILAMTAEFQQAQLEKRLEDSLDHLAGVGIQPVLLKGAGLAATVYRSFQERPMGDIDLLIDRSEAELAKETLLRGGWVRDDATPGDDFYEGHHHLPPMEDASGSGVGVELHTDLFSSGNPFEALGRIIQDEARSVIWKGREVLVPREAPHLVYICLHFAWSHQLHRGAWRTFRDVCVLAERAPLDWDEVVELAERTNGVSCCYWTLRFAAGIAGADVPESVLSRLRPADPSLLRERLDRHFIQQLFPLGSKCPSISVDRWVWRLAIRPVRSGHGGSRPWHHDADFLCHSSDRAAEGRGKVVSHIRNRHRWQAYLRAILRDPYPPPV